MRKTAIILLSLFMGCANIVVAQKKNNNIAYSDNTVRFTVISEGTMRMEYSPEGRFVNNKSFVAVNREYPEVEYKIKTSGQWIEIRTSKLTLKYKKASGKFTDANLSISGNKTIGGFTWKPGMKQKSNLLGTYRTLDGYNGDSRDDTGKMPIEDGLLAKDGWTLIDDSKGLLFDNDTDWEWVENRPSEDAQDWYFMGYGKDYKSALKDFTSFAGKMPLPPRYAFGYWWSRYWSYSDKELRDLVDKFDAYGIPLDVLVIDMDWHYTEKGRGGWTGWTWNKRLFPNPKALMHHLKENNLKVTLNLHPADGVASYEEGYTKMAAEMGIDSISGKTIPWTSSDKQFISAIFKNILKPMEADNGVDFWWLDWQQTPFDANVKNLSNTWWLNYVFFSEMEKTRDTRPMLYHRWGGLGNHRYQIGFSGDAIISWKSLDFQPYFNSTASNVLYGYWSHDIGGHMGGVGKIDPEMYIRWLQFGALSPIMRTHSSKSSELNKEPWIFSQEYSGIIRNTIRQRYSLVPYIYTMARHAYDNGISLCRPLYYDYPEQSEAYSFRNEYMFGDNILVAPITSPMQGNYSKQQIWLPEGSWYELHTGTILNGGAVIERKFAIDEYPLYVKSGSILPMYGDNIMRLCNNNEPIVISVFPGNDGESEFNLYEDNGNDKNYATDYAVTRLTSSISGTTQTITIGKREGTYKDIPKERKFTIKLISSAVPQTVMVNGKQTECFFSAKDMTVVIDLPSLKGEEESTIIVSYHPEKTDMNGIFGQAHRIAKAIEQLKYRDAGIVLNDKFGPMGSLAEAIEYNPENIHNLVDSFRQSYAQLPEVLKEQGLSEKDQVWFLEAINWKP